MAPPQSSSFRTRAYGLDLVSGETLPGFVALAPQERLHAAPWRVDLPGHVSRFGEVIRTGREPENDDEMEVRRPSEHALGIYFSDGAHFVVDAAQRTIKGTWAAPLTFDDAMVYLVGPVLGAAVRLEGRTILHASAVRGRRGAILLCGEAGAGKSTLTAALVEHGVPLISEDVAALGSGDAASVVFRGGTRVKLWEDSVAGLRGRSDALPLLVPASIDWHKRFLPADDRMVAEDAIALESILIVAREPGAASPRVDAIAPQERALALIANAYGSYFVTGVAQRRLEMERLVTLARTVPVLRLTLPDGWERLRAGVEFVAAMCEVTSPERPRIP